MSRDQISCILKAAISRDEYYELIPMPLFSSVIMRPNQAATNPGSASRAGVARVVALIAVTLLMGVGSVYAQNGKIRAKVVDARSGEPLVHASVQITETRQGAYTKDDGIATIINVAPSENYTVVAKNINYKSSTQTKVKVQSDVTVDLVFRLSQTTDTITVIAETKMVEKTKTDLSTKYSTTTLQSLPGRQRIDEVIKLTPGIVQDNSNGGISIHGSRGTSNAIMLNGTDITDPLTGRATTLQNSLSRLAVSEVNVTTAGGDASKGGFTGGSINTQTRQGGANFEGTAHYRMEVPSLFGTSGNGYKQTAQGDKIYEFALGGPLVGEDLKFNVTAKANTFDFYNTFSDPSFSNNGLGVIDPLGNNLGQLPYTDRIRRAATAKLTFNVSGFATSADYDYGFESDELNNFTRVMLDPYYIPGVNDFQNVYSLNTRGQIGEGVLEFTASYFTDDYRNGKYDHSSKMGIFSPLKFYSVDDNFTYNDEDHTIVPGADGVIDSYTPVSRQISDPRNPTQPYSSQIPATNPFTGHIEGPAIYYSSNNPYGLLGFYPVSGNVGGFLIQNTKQIQLNGTYNIQMGAHLVNVGFDTKLYNVYKYANDLPWDASPFRDSFQVHPYVAAAYVTDKMEYSDITFAPGVRVDMYHPDAKVINNLYDPLTGGTAPASNQIQVSPRLGITYAVTEQTTFNFNYGWYFKQPALGTVLTNTAGGDLAAVLRRGNQILGNGGLDAERSKEIDVGFNTQLSDVFAMSVQGVYKDFRNEAGLQRITSPLLPVGYTIYSSDQYGSSRNIELVLEKRMRDNYSARFNYTYSVSKGTSSSATENYSALINQDPNSEQVVLPLQPFNLSYDKPHVAQFLFTLAYNKDEGPTIFGTKLLQYVTLATTTEYYSGTPYTRTDLKGRQVGEFNGDREPSFFQTDATLQRTIPFEDLFGESMKDVTLDLQLEVTNLFNQTEALFVYPTTGQGDNDGTNRKYPATQEYYNDPTNARGGSLDAFGHLIYNPRIDLNGDGRISLDEQQSAYDRFIKDSYARRTNYQVPRKVFLNFTLRF